MAKRFFVTVLCAVMALALLPAAARAAGATVEIGGVTLGNGKYYVNGGTVFDTEPATGWNAHLNGTTLYLKKLNLLNYSGQYGIKIEADAQTPGGDFSLVLNGDSKVSVSGADDYTYYGLYVGNYNLTVTQGSGGGSLTASAENTGFIFGAIGVSMYVATGVNGGKLMMKSGALTGEAASSTGGYGVSALNNDITVESGTLIGRPISGKNCRNGIYSALSKINVSGGTLTGEGEMYGIYAFDGMAISRGNVTGTGKGSYSCGIYSENSPIVISGGTVRGDSPAAQGGRGIFAPTKIEISGGSALFTGPDMALLTDNHNLILGPGPYTATASTAYTENPTDSYDKAQLYNYKSLRVVSANPVPPDEQDTSDGGITLPLAVTVSNPDVYAAPGETARMQVAATGSAGPFHFQWFKRTGPKAAWQKISGATELFYDTGVLKLANDGLQYSCLVTDNMTPAAQVRSAVIQLHVGSENGAANGTRALPATGDGQTPLLWVGLCALCGAGLMALRFGKKRRA